MDNTLKRRNLVSALLTVLEAVEENERRSSNTRVFLASIEFSERVSSFILRASNGAELQGVQWYTEPEEE